MLHKFLVSMVKKLFKSVHIYWSYRQNKPGGPFFGPHGRVFSPLLFNLPPPNLVGTQNDDRLSIPLF